MFASTPSGRVIVRSSEWINPGQVKYVAFGLYNFFHAAHKRYEYGPQELQAFCASLAFVLPLLLTGESHGWGSSAIRLPYSYYATVLKWGLALGHTPLLSCSRRYVYIYLCTMSDPICYRAELQRLATRALGASLARFPCALFHGHRQFLTILESSLRTIERDGPRIVWTSPVVHCLSLDKCSSPNCEACLLGRNRLLLTGCFSDITRYYNELDLQDFEVDLWYAAGISLHQAGERYFEGSFLQKILQ